MPHYDCIVRSTQVLTPSGRVDGQIGIRHGKIVGLLDPHVPATADRLISVGDQAVIPGLIDTHVHFRDPGFTYKEDFESGTRAAAAGGVTTVFDMPNVDPPTTTAERLTAHLDNAAAKAVVDFGHNASGTQPDTIAELADAGAAAIKIWMMADIGRSYPHLPGTSVTNHAVLYRVFEAVAATGLPLYVHPDDHDLYGLFVQRARARWGTDFRSYVRARRSGDSVLVNSGIATALEFQRSTGCRLHLLHVSSRAGVEMVRRAKAEGRPVTAEVNPGHMFITNDWAEIDQRGPYPLGGWVPEDDSDAMWEGVLDGTLDVIGSDHGPHTREEKELGWTDMYAAPGGSPLVEHYLRLLLDGVNNGRLSLERVVEMCCENPARLTGFAGQKGRIAVGADADLVVLELDRQETLRAADSHYRCGWLSIEGRVTKGAPVMTMLRGKIVMQDGQVTGQPGTGRALKPARDTFQAAR